MVLQIAPDARTLQHGFDAQRSKPVRGPDAGAVQHLYRSDRAGAENDLAFCIGLDDLSALNKAHAGGAAVLDDEAIDQHVLFKTQIGAAQYGFQKSARRRPASAALLVDMKIADALIIAGVEIRNFANPHFHRCVCHGVENFPGQPRRFDAPAAAYAMMRAVPEEMIFETSERRQ